MLKRSALVLLAALSASVAATLAQAASKHHFTQTVQLSGISQSASYPNPGSSAVDAGITIGSEVGTPGALIQHVKITGHPNATTYTFTGTNTAYFAHGTIRSTLSGTATVQTNGSVSIKGHGSFTGGTDSYRGAKGNDTFTGTIPPASTTKPTPSVAHVSGTISY